MLYIFVHLKSALIRQFILPNPYINIIGNEVYASFFNIFIGGTILHFCAYILTGCGYNKGINDPTFGSIGYLISYCYVTILITILGCFISNITVFIMIFIFLYMASCLLVRYIFNRSISL